MRTIAAKSRTTTSRRGALLLLAASACGLSTEGGNAGSDIQLQTSTLTAATTLVGALNGRVVRPAGVSSGGTIIASTPGQVSANDDGSASYVIPLWTPAGFGGVRPTLSVQYSSSGAQGLFGKRWGLGGLSKLMRCPQTLAQDGVESAINYHSGDTFCLDGQRLVRTSGTTSQAGEFRTEGDPSVRIVLTSVSAGTPQGFTVWRPDGLAITYGTTPQSRLHGGPYSATQTGTLPDSVLTWYEDSVTDRYNNVMRISYANATTTVSPRPAELVPSLITYGQRSVTFVYPGAPAFDNAHTQWINGLGIAQGGLPSEIYMSGPGVTNGTIGTSVLKSYRLGYKGGAITNATILSSVTECDARGTTAICKRPTLVTWEPGSVQYLREDLGVSDASQVLTDYTNHDQSAVLRRMIPADLNGDGLDDIVYRKPLNGSNCIGWAAVLAMY